VTTTGSSGLTGVAPTYQWLFGGAPLANGTNADGAVITGATTSVLSLKTTGTAEAGTYAVLAANNLDGYSVSGTMLEPNTIAVSATSSAATLTVNTPFDNFVLSYGLNPGTNGAPTADPAGDGVSNLAKFVLGGNPTVYNENILPTLAYTGAGASANAFFAFNYNTAAAASVTMTVEYSSDLKNWTTAANNQSGVTITNTMVNGSIDRMTVTIPAPGGAFFARLVVSE
jgi:hypothetical protein